MYSSIVKLYENIPFNDTYAKSVDFDNYDDQINFFNHYLGSPNYNTTFTDCHFIKPNTIKLEVNYNNVMSVNYLSYLNSNDKIIYCFVVDKKYINDNVVEFTFKTDYYQTYLFNHSLDECYIDRMHHDRAEKYSLGIDRKYHEITENIDLGTQINLIDEKKFIIPENVFINPSLIICTNVLDDYLIDEETTTATLDKYQVDDIKTPFHIYINTNINDNIPCKVNCKIITDNVITYDIKTVEIYPLDSSILKNKKVIAVVPLQRVPFNAPYNATNNFIDLSNLDIIAVKNKSTLLEQWHLKLIKNEKVELGTFSVNEFIPPFNKLPLYSNHLMSNESKLFTDPYFQMYLMTNYENRTQIFNEKLKQRGLITLFYDIIATFDFVEIISFLDDDYNMPNSNIIDNADKSIPLSTDEYLNYMQNNKASRTAGIAIPLMTTALGVGATALGGGAVGIPLIMGGVASMGSVIANDQARMQDLKNTPSSVRNARGNILLDKKMGLNKYKIQIIKPLNEYLKKAYDFMRIYGYKTQRILKPNLKSRYFYNYIKTIGANVKPLNDKVDNLAINELINIYDRGIIIYHYHDDEVFNFNYENIETGLLDD